MHTIAESGTSVPAFLGKLWKLVEDSETDDLICWAPDGRSFYIRNQAEFARELLPHYYKHNNMASFVRQLNMYGFHKKVSVELGGLKCEKDEMEFAHQFFCKGHPYLLGQIKRKIATNKGHDPSQAPMKPELMNKMLTEVRIMRGRQETLDTRLGAMKRENEALWRELALLRQKHIKQQQIVNKLIHFLVTLVQPSRSGGGIPVKRRYPLMIDEPGRRRDKQSKMSNNGKQQASPTGPVIHELDPTEHDLEPQYIVAEMLENHQSPAVQSPEQHENLIDENVETILVDDTIQLPEAVQLVAQHDVESRKKRGCKGKKKEETLLLEVSPSATSSATPTMSLVENKMTSKPVPSATVRSSKLAAMVANMNTADDLVLDLDLDSSAATEEDHISDVEPALQKLEDILIMPDDGSNGANGNGLEIGKGSFGNVSGIGQSPAADKPESDTASTSTSAKDLTLSCVNPSGMSEAAYRLGPMDEVDTHLESMQNDLDNLRDILRGEGYSIDANTLLGLFGADDPMSFGIPMNPELDPHAHRDKDDEGCDSHNGAAGGELMAYNPPTSLLDFEDDIFMNDTHLTANGSTDMASDPLDLEDSKASLLESLVAVSDENTAIS